MEGTNKYKDVRIEKTGDTARIYTPYDPDFVKRIKSQIGGAKWSYDGYWEIPADAVIAVRAIMEDVYGHSDISEDTLLKVKVTVKEDIIGNGKKIYLLGKMLVSAYSRDSGAKCGQDVCFIKGGGGSAGSRNYPHVYIDAGSELLITNVSKNLLDKLEPSDKMDVEIISEENEGEENSDNQTPSTRELMEERERLSVRINEIDEILRERRGKGENSETN